MRVKAAVLAAVAALGLLGAGCKSYETQGSAQVAGEEPLPPPGDPAFRNSSGVHGDRNTLDERTGVFDGSGQRSEQQRR